MNSAILTPSRRRRRHKTRPYRPRVTSITTFTDAQNIALCARASSMSSSRGKPANSRQTFQSTGFEFSRATRENFDEQGYLDANPDVAEAVLRGQFPSGRAHFDRHGHSRAGLYGHPSAGKMERSNERGKRARVMRSRFAKRPKILGRKGSSLKILVMGLPGAGKTTLTHALAPMLGAVWFSGEEVRAALSKDLGFTLADRIEQARRMGWLCDCVTKAGLVAIADFVCPTPETREAFGRHSWCGLIESMRADLRTRIGYSRHQIALISAFCPMATRAFGQTGFARRSNNSG